MECTSELIPRILRDVDDSVLALDERGHIIYMNPQCLALLGLHACDVGRTYAEVFFDEKTKDNDAFHQLVVDAVCQKEQTHKDCVAFTDAKGKKLYLRITSSFLKRENQDEAGGVVLVLSDVTETESLKKKRYDASIVFSCITACVCLYLLLLALLDFLHIRVQAMMLTQVINGMVCIAGFIMCRKTNVSTDELGLKLHNPQKTFGYAFAISGSVVAALAAVKLLPLQVAPGFFPADAPFWNWNIGTYGWISYIFTSILQEFLARSLVYGSIKKLFDGKHRAPAAIILSSLLFGAVHIAHGFMYMMAAIVLLGALGGLYEKQRNIWGVAIIHYVLGEAATCLGFLA